MSTTDYLLLRRCNQRAIRNVKVIAAVERVCVSHAAQVFVSAQVSVSNFPTVGNQSTPPKHASKVLLTR